MTSHLPGAQPSHHQRHQGEGSELQKVLGSNRKAQPKHAPEGSELADLTAER